MAATNDIWHTYTEFKDKVHNNLYYYSSILYESIFLLLIQCLTMLTPDSENAALPLLDPHLKAMFLLLILSHFSLTLAGEGAASRSTT